MEQRELIYKFLNKATSVEEDNALLSWVELSPENARIFAEAKNLQTAVEFQTNPLNVNLKEEFDLTWNKLSNIETGTNSRLVLFRSFMRYAAIVIVTFSIAYFLFNDAPAKSLSATAITYNQVFTTKGQKTQLVLIDGTKVWLNSDSRLKYGNDYNRYERIIYLDGEAYFEVAKNREKPFLVKTSKITVKALGTSFDVKAYSSEDVFETSLMTGSVSIENDYLKDTKENKLLLIPNQRYIFSKKTNPSVAIIDNKDLKAYKAWVDNVLVFQSESLAEIALKLERWFDVKVHVLDKSIIKNIYSGTFKNKESIRQVLGVLKQTTPMQFSIKQNDIYIFKK